jgi:hypothetical protein
MCDQNIAVSIRNLNQMSSIIPNRMEKLKLASLSAGIVAGFTTDCFYDADTSLSKGYDATVSDRVNDLSSVLKNYIVLNKSWYDSGARTISDIRNIFITGRKHPLNTLNNVFSVITRIEFNQNAMDNGVKINAAKNILMKYDLSLDIPFHRLITNTREKGLLVTLNGFRENIIKSAKRITSDGKRLDILDERQLSIIISVVAGLIIGYAEPLPSTTVDFNEYYATTAYPFAVSLTNELVEKLTIDTDSLFAAYRSTIEARYELTYEPVATVRGLLSILTTNDILSKNMSEAITNSNKEELIEYIVSMVKGVYDVRKEHLERSVLHELDHLPIDTPFYQMFNKPESHADIQKCMEEMVTSVESILLTKYDIDLKNQVSLEAMTGSQKFGVLLVVLGGALMAYAIYLEFFKKEKVVAAKTIDFKADVNKQLEATNKMLKQQAANHAAISAHVNDVMGNIDKILDDALGENWKTSLSIDNTNDAKKVVTAVSNGLGSSNPDVSQIKLSTVKYELKGDLGEAIGDLSKTTISDNLKRFVKYKAALANNELEAKILPTKFTNIKSIADFDKYIWQVKDEIAIISKTYRPMPWHNDTGKIVTDEQVLGYMKVNFNNPELTKGLEECVRFSETNIDRVSKINYEQLATEYETILKKNIPTISDKQLKSSLADIASLNKKIQEVYRFMGTAFIRFNKLVMAWDDVVRRRNKTITNALKVITSTKPPVKIKV